jgi:hypothetical protein
MYHTQFGNTVLTTRRVVLRFKLRQLYLNLTGLGNCEHRLLSPPSMRETL